jgi:membrane-associated phospholipid phosphatase
VDSLIAAFAQYGLFLVALGAGLVWLRVGRREKVGLAVQVVVAMLLVAVLVRLAGLVHFDPRPFVSDPSLKPLFLHAADNGFPSDHTALATAVAATVAVYRRQAGLVLLLVSVLLGWARVAAHVHHWQDVLAGLLIGLAAATMSALACRRLQPR